MVAANKPTTRCNWRAVEAIDQARYDNSLTGICHRGEDGKTQIAIAKQIGGYRRCHHPDDNRPSRRRTRADQDTGGHPGSRPKHRNAVRLREQGKA